MASRPQWKMTLGFPSCSSGTEPERPLEELVPGVPHACSHLYVKKSADSNLIHISLSPATPVGSREGSAVGGEAEEPQGMQVLRSGPLSITIYPMPPRATNNMPRIPQSAPAFASLADERAAKDMGVLLMSRPISRRRMVRSSGRSSPFRHSRLSLADGRSRKACNPGSVFGLRVQLTMPSRAFEVDIKPKKVVDDAAAKLPNELARTGMGESPHANGETTNRIRFDKHTISSLISSRIGDLNREARMLQELDCKRKEAYRLQRPPWGLS